MDRNNLRETDSEAFLSRTPQECVDRNCIPLINRSSYYLVALHRSAWIEMFIPTAMSLSAGVALHRSAWIEINPKYMRLICAYGRTPQECVDRNLIIVN